ncbi:MAG: class I SAM-dependent methyltransferase [Ardenticatenales bacterium]|nr:class I SAM-dependent methyltransferase [Ardenticatenales bacterium]
MRGITHTLLEGIDFPNAPIVEIGCGGGAFLGELKAHYPTRQAIGLDLNPVALAHTKQAVTASVMQANLHHLPLASEQCGAIIGLDVFDQQGVDLLAALRESQRVLQPGGILLLRVSAYDWLRGPHDVAFGTGRRYSASEVTDTLRAAGLELLRLTYANSLLLLPAILVRLAQQGGHTAVQAQLNTPPLLNTLFKAMLQSEAHWLRHASLPAGLSLYALARK